MVISAYGCIFSLQMQIPVCIMYGCLWRLERHERGRRAYPLGLGLGDWPGAGACLSGTAPPGNICQDSTFRALTWGRNTWDSHFLFFSSAFCHTFGILGFTVLESASSSHLQPLSQEWSTEHSFIKWFFGFKLFFSRTSNYNRQYSEYPCTHLPNLNNFCFRFHLKIK